VSATPEGLAVRSRAGCLGDTLLQASGETPAALGALNSEIARLRDAVYDYVGDWKLSDVR
jgi:hypothetical protein